jgi:hypothetical protein
MHAHAHMRVYACFSLFLYCETLLGREWHCFIFCRILSLGYMDGRDVPGWFVLRMLRGVMLKCTCSVFVIPFQSYAGVYRSGPVRPQLVSFQQSVS